MTLKNVRERNGLFSGFKSRFLNFISRFDGLVDTLLGIPHRTDWPVCFPGRLDEILIGLDSPINELMEFPGAKQVHQER